jgi:hypothetical protein
MNKVFRIDGPGPSQRNSNLSIVFLESGRCRMTIDLNLKIFWELFKRELRALVSDVNAGVLRLHHPETQIPALR